MKKILLIVGGDFHRKSGVENYNLILLNILQKYYKNYVVDIALLGCNEKPENLKYDNVKFVFYKVAKHLKSTYLNILLNWYYLISDRRAIKKIINNYDLVIDSSLTNLPCARKNQDYYLIQHFNLDFYYFKFNEKKLTFKKIMLCLLAILNGTYNFFKNASNMIVFDSLNANKALQLNYKVKIYPISLPSKISSVNLSTLNKNKNKIIFLGRLAWQKNIPALIKINQSLDLIDFFGIPFGELGYQYKNELVKYGWYRGILNSESNIKDELSKYKFMILYSRFEGFPFSLVEALSQGVPIIVKNTFLSASYLCNSKTGLLLPASTPIENDIELIKKFVSISSEKYHQFQINCIDFYNENLSMSIFEKKWCSIFDEYLDKK